MRPRAAARIAIEPPERPAVVAHRGSSEQAAEHTLAAYVAAIDAGADALECDVRLTRDGHLVCVHDRTVNRTSDGRGVVSEFDLADLNELDFSSWHGTPATGEPDTAGSAGSRGPDDPAQPYLAGVAPDRVDPGGGVLTLERLLELVQDCGRPVRLLIETKHPTRYGGLVEKELVDLLRKFDCAGQAGPGDSLRTPADLAGPATVMSFAPTALRRIKLLAPDVPTVLLMERMYPVRSAGVLPVGVPIAGPGLHLLHADPRFVARAHARGHPVYVWTVDEPADVRFVAELGVDKIITNRPAAVRAQLGMA